MTGIRIAKNGRQLYDNYRAIEEEITHADIDILTSKRFSVNSPNGLLQIPATNGNGALKTGTSSPARTPSSENKSLDSALSSGIVSDITSQSSNGPSSFSSGSEYQNQNEESESSQSNTPVNTMDRSNNIHNRSMSRSSKSSSSSGCSSHNVGEHGFESDFPAGGTIKKRPAVNPRLPLTNTTWGLVRDSEDEDEVDANVRVGGGGTLLRSAVRQSYRKNEQQKQQVMAEVHHQPNANVEEDPLSAEFENNLNLPLPPPPRDESLERLNSVDDLPPPPPEIYAESPRLPPLPPPVNTKPVVPPMSTKPILTPPAPLPPSLKRNTSSPVCSPKRNGRRISFDDNVQMIDDKLESKKEFFPFVRKPMPPPNKLYGESSSEAAPPKAFLQDLQRVMNKKWQIAEKCRQDVSTSPHQVLGFRDADLQNLVGQPQRYSRDDSVGAWVLQSQQFNSHNEPLYAVARKPRSQHYAAPPVASPPVILREPTPEYDPYSSLTNGSYHQSDRADVSNYSTLTFQNQTATSPAPPQLASVHRNSFRSNSSSSLSSGGQSRKPPPPPPKRSENTQLTTTNLIAQ